MNPADFGVTVDVSGPPGEIAVRGDVDVVTSPYVAAMLATIVDLADADVTLDLGAVTFLDASGLGVLAVTADRLRQRGATLVLRSAAPWIVRVLALAGLDRAVAVEAAADRPVPASLGAEQHVADRPAIGAGRIDDGWSDLARMVAVPADNVLIDAALRLVVTLAQATVGGADGVSVSLHRGGRIETVAWSDDTVAQMDRDQYATGEGPCLAAAADGHWFHVESLADERRWPDFTRRARAGGIGSILSSPLLVDSAPVGALNIYSRTERVFGQGQQELAALFASQASGILADARVDVTVEQAAQRLQEALLSRQVIAQAQGMTMERSRLSADDAYVALIRAARLNATSLRSTATERLTSAGPEAGADG